MDGVGERERKGGREEGKGAGREEPSDWVKGELSRRSLK